MTRILRLAIAFTIPVLLTLAATPQARAADRVALGVLNNASDAGFYIAKAKGYFKDAGIEPDFTVFSAAAKMVASLSSGELDAGGGAPAVGIYNAAERQIGIRMVADRGRMATGYQYQTLMIRKDLLDSGAFKSLADLKGKKIAFAATGVAATSVVNEAAKKGGVAFKDIEQVYLGFPEQVVAFSNKAIDGSIMVEPFGTVAVNNGYAVRFMSTEEFYPNDQVSVVFFGEKFAKDKPDVAHRFLKAYIRGVRDYNDVMLDGKIASGPKGDEVVTIIAQAINQKPESIRAMYVPAIDPDGRINEESIRKDTAFFQAQGQIKDAKIVDKVLDLSFVDRVNKELGPYKKAATGN